MKKSKEIKIKQLTQIKIWPSLVGSAISLLLFDLLIVLFVLVYLASICTMKLTDMSNTVQSVLKYFEMTQEMSIQDRYYAVEHLAPEVKGITYYSSDMEEVAFYGKEKMNFNDFSKVEGFYMGDNREIAVYIPKGLEKVVTVDDKDNNLEIDMQEFISNPQVRIDYELLNEIQGNDWTKKEVVGFDTVFMCKEKQGDGYYAIKTRFSICSEDYMMAIIVMTVIGTLFVVMLIYHVVSTIRLIFDKRRAYNALFTDITTGGKNSLAFYKKSDEIIQKQRGKVNYAVCQLRLEKYKGLLSCYGTKWVDNITDTLYENIKKMVEKTEQFARIENGDFGLLLKYENEEELISRVGNIMEVLSSSIDGQKLYFNAGICLCNVEKTDAKAFYNNASIARSTAKDENSAEINMFTEALFEAQRWERKVEEEMESAMAAGQFEMYLQPKYTTSDKVVGGAEALVRWNHPTEGLIPPGKFIPIFEKDGFILKLDDFMINELSRQLAKWISEGKEVFPISVNVSRAHFMMEDLAEYIRDIVDKYGVPHKYIELELTESAFFDDKKQLIEIVKRMREYGFPVSMDDFGAGYSSLNSLKEIPLDVVKLDADFFRGEESDRGKIIVSKTIDLAKKLGMHIVAEGIETKDQVDFLEDRKCDLIQGYYFAKPMKVSDFEQRAFGQLSE